MPARHPTRRSGAPLLVTAGLVALFVPPAPSAPPAPQGREGRAAAERDGTCADVQPGTGSLTVEEVVCFETLAHQSPVHVSPDGERVAYTVSFARRTQGTTHALRGASTGSVTGVRVTDLRTGDTERMPAGGANSWGPSWSPDGSRLAFYSNRDGAAHVWLWHRASGRTERVSDAAVWSVWTRQVPRWTPDGSTLVVKLVPEGRTFAEMQALDAPAPPSAGDAVPGATPRVYRSGAGDDPAIAFGWLRWRYGGDLAALDVESGRVRRLTSGRVPTWWDVSPDGSLVGLIEAADPDDLTRGYRLSVVPSTGGAVRELPGTLRQGWGEAASWSPVTNRLAYVSGGRGEDAGVFVADAETLERHRLSAARAGWGEAFRGPLWAPDGTGLFVSEGGEVWRLDVESGEPSRVVEIPDRRIRDLVAPRAGTTAWAGTRPLIASLVDPASRRTGFARIDPRSGRILARTEEEGLYGAPFGGTFHMDVARDGSALVTRFSDTGEPTDLWRLDADLRRAGRVTRLNPALVAERLGAARRVEWTTDDGRELAGALLLPPEREEGERVPVIVDVYGGDAGSAEVHRFTRHRQLLASRGWAVLAPDVPLEDGAPLRDHAHAVLPALDRLVEMGIADPGRLGVTGHSYGGYGTLALLVQSGRFAAAVASAAQGDLFGMYLHLDADGATKASWVEHGQGGMSGTPWELRERYIENSPVFHLDRVRTPLLLLHGAEDQNTPVYLAGHVYAGLAALGRTAAFVRYEGEGHWPGAWSPANQIDYWRRLVAWFEEHL